jgi:hypothetical protein
LLSTDFGEYLRVEGAATDRLAGYEADDGDEVDRGAIQRLHHVGKAAAAPLRGGQQIPDTGVRVINNIILYFQKCVKSHGLIDNNAKMTTTIVTMDTVLMMAKMADDSTVDILLT